MIERNTRSIMALAAQHGTSITPTLARSIAFQQALGTLHHRETLRALAAFCVGRKARRSDSTDPT